jgi:hypothetical protein
MLMDNHVPTTKSKPPTVVSTSATCVRLKGAEGPLSQQRKALRENLCHTERAPYMYEFPSKKLGGILYLLLKRGRQIMLTCRCKKPPTFDE